MDPRVTPQPTRLAKVKTVLGDHIHKNNGSHLTEGVQDDLEWQGYWAHLTNNKLALFEFPEGKIGKWFVSRLVV